MDTHIKRQNLENCFEKPKSIANLCTAGLGIIGVCFCFQPSGIAKTISISALLTGGCTLALSRLSHKSYVDAAFEQSEEVVDRHAQELAVKTTEATRLNQQLQQLQAEHSGMAQSEQRFKTTAIDLQKQVVTLEAERRSTSAQYNDLMQSQQQCLATLRATTIESLNNWKTRLADALSDIKRRFPDLAARIDKISAGFQQDVEFFALEIAQIEGNASLNQAADELVSILHSMYDRFSSVRVQMVKAIDIHRLQLSEIEKQKLETENEAFQSRDVVPREQLQTLAKNYESRLQEFQSNLQTHKDLTLNFADELEGEIKNQDPVFLRMRILIQQQNEQIAALQTQVAEARQIKFFDSVGWKSELANKVLHHFLAQEIVCDACSMPMREIGMMSSFSSLPAPTSA